MIFPSPALSTNFGKFEYKRGARQKLYLDQFEHSFGAQLYTFLVLSLRTFNLLRREPPRRSTTSA